MKIQLLAVAAVLTLASCAGTQSSSINCDQDWRLFGLETGKAGNSVRTFDKYVNSCLNLPENAKAEYQAGYLTGIAEYCTYENGVAIGEGRLPYPNTCPAEMREQFDKGYYFAKRNQDGKDRMFRKRVEEKLLESMQTRSQPGK